MNWKFSLLILLFSLPCSTSINADNDVKCFVYLNNSDVTICDCVDIKDKLLLMECVDKKHDELLEFIHSSPRYRARNRGVRSDLGFYDWAIAELKYIESLEYETPVQSRIRRILFNQNVLQTGMSILSHRGLLFGGTELTPYVEIIQKYNPKSLEGYSIEELTVEDPSEEHALFVESELRNILNSQIKSSNSPLLKDAQEKWMDFFNKHIESYETEDDITLEGLAHRCIVLDYLKKRILLLSEYSNPDSDMTWDRLFNFRLSELDLYELITGQKVKYEN